MVLILSNMYLVFIEDWWVGSQTLGFSPGCSRYVSVSCDPRIVVIEVYVLLSPHCAFLYAGSGPSAQIYDNNVLPELPSVPDTLPNSSLGGNPGASDDIDFDDLSRRFEELKKKT